MKLRAKSLREEAFSAADLDHVDRRIRATVHPKQGDYVFDPASYLSLLTSRGAGKTTAGLMRLLRRALRTPKGNCLFIASTRDHARRLVWRDLKRLLNALGIVPVRWSEVSLTCELRNGAEISLFGADAHDDVERLRGITYHEVVVDEAASIKNDVMAYLLDDVIGPRMIGALTIMGTPGKVLLGLFYEVTRRGSPEHRAYADRDRPEYAGWIKTSSHTWNIRDGVAHRIAEMRVFWEKGLEKKLSKGWSDTNPTWLREYEGEWVGDDSMRVYAFHAHLTGEAARSRGVPDGTRWNEWDPQLDHRGFAILPADLKDVVYGIGVDLGFKDWMAIEVFAFSLTDPSRRLYHVHEVYQTKQYAKGIATLLIGGEPENLRHEKYGGIIGAIGQWPVRLVGDFAGQGGQLLKELALVYSITIEPADKPYKYKHNSIAETNSMMHEGQIWLLKGSAVAAEMTTLQWTVDAKERQVENKGQANHGCDATIYIRDAVAPLLPNAGGPPPPQKPRDPEADAERPTESAYGDADSMYDYDAVA